MAAKTRTIPSPMRIATDHWATWRTSALAAAVEIDLFTAIDEGKRTADAIASRASANASAMRRLLDVMVAMKYLAHRGEKYELTPVARTYLSRKSDLFMEGIDQVSRMLSMSWQQLAQTVRSGRPATEGGASRGEFFAILVKSIFPQSYAGGKIAARGIPPQARKRIRNILDVGGGAASWSISIAEEIPGARVTLVDLPEVVPVARQYAERHDVADRFDYREGNFREVEFGAEQFELVILGHIIHGEGAEWGKRLIARCAAALRSKGMLLIADLIQNDARSGPALPMLFDLNMLLHTPAGATFTMGEYREWLKAAGFGPVKLIKSAALPSPLILATKP
jgi:2-polyprenyl-3-methyl-5-hydroxy-6-metoxy-1,4-benzoquinol methylase